MIVEDCYATPTADPHDATKYLYFNDKCGIDPTVKVRASNHAQLPEKVSK